MLDASLPLLPGSADGPGHALVRPEAVSFIPAADGGAVLSAVTFLGPVSRATATLDDGTELVSQVEGTHAAAMTVGDRVRVEIDVAPVLVVAG